MTYDLHRRATQYKPHTMVTTSMRHRNFGLEQPVGVICAMECSNFKKKKGIYCGLDVIEH